MSDLADGDWTAIPNRILMDGRLSPHARTLWAILRAAVYRHGAGDSCRPTQEELGEWLGRKPRQVSAYVAELRDAGLIEVRQEGFGRAATYHVPLTPEASRDSAKLASRNIAAPPRGISRRPKEEDSSLVEQLVFPGENGSTPSSRAVPSRAREAAEVGELFGYWQERCGHPRAKLSPARRRKIEQRLREGYAPAQIRTAIDGAALNAFVDDSGVKHDDIELICRSAEKLDRFIARASAAPRAPAGGAAVSALADWREKYGDRP